MGYIRKIGNNFVLKTKVGLCEVTKVFAEVTDNNTIKSTLKQDKNLSEPTNDGFYLKINDIE